MLSKAKLQYLKTLSQKKNREKEGVFLVEGWRGVEEASGALNDLEILVYSKDAKGDDRHSSVFSLASKRSREQIEVSSREFGQIADTVVAQGIAAVVKKIPRDSEAEIQKLSKRERAFVVGLDQIADPGNLGAIIRTTDWFGVDAVFLSRDCVELYNPKVVRSSVGSIFHLPIVDCSTPAGSFESALRRLRKGGFRLFGATVSGKTDLRSLVWPKKSLLVIGSEARGISSEVSNILDEQIAIRKFGNAESLNAGVAAGIFLSHASFQTRK